MMAKFKNGLKNGLMNEFIPIPTELAETTAQFGANVQEKLNIEKYGFASWYDFSIANWGTKWDVDNVQFSEDNGVIHASYDTAWSPPMEFYDHLVNEGFSVKVMYYEPGMCFCGVYQDGNDDTYDLSNMDSDEVMDTIPTELDEAFAISEQMADYEAENQEDDE
jgi:hypothetical protein